MVSKLRIKGRILLVGNIGLMCLVLATCVMVTVCINFSVLIYELFLKKGDVPLVDLGVSLLLFIVGISVFCQIRLGADRFFLRRSQKRGATAADIFCYFHPLRAVSAFLFCIKLSLVRFVYVIISFLPAILSLIFLLHLTDKGVSLLVGVVLAVGCVAFFLSGMGFYRNINASLFLAKYHFINGDCISFRHLLSSSQENMKSRRKTLMRLKFSFSGWFLLCLLILPIGYVWSYYNQTMAVAAAEFIEG